MILYCGQKCWIITRENHCGKKENFITEKKYKFVLIVLKYYTMTKKIKKYKIEARNESIISEAALLYQSNHAIGSFAAILADATKKPERHLTSFEKMDILRDGISKKDLELLKNKAGLDYTMLAKALSVTRATLINKKRDQKFGAVVSEKIIGLADLYSYGFEVFENEERFNQWMAKPNKALGGHAPYDLIDNQYGREEVKNLIGRVDYGVYS
jgi:putative toxin-antitoxin system antitoxin component (TIGR02293 family)